MRLSAIASGAACLFLVATSCAYRIPARAYLRSDQEPPKSAAPDGYIVWTARFNPSETARAAAACEAYLRVLEPVAGFRNRAPDDFVVTYWLLTGKSTTPRPVHCKGLVAEYDFPRAARLAATVEMPGARGPLLVAGAHGVDGKMTEYLVLDCSDFSDADLDRAFGIWKDRVSRDPTVWRKGFQLVVLREAFRNHVERYGQEILKVAKGS